MRTTVEIRDELRASLLEIAARRGEKGFSRLVEEAIERYLVAERGKEGARRAALARRGMLPQAEADDLAQRARRIRESWR